MEKKIYPNIIFLANNKNDVKGSKQYNETFHATFFVP